MRVALVLQSAPCLSAGLPGADCALSDFPACTPVVALAAAPNLAGEYGLELWFMWMVSIQTNDLTSLRNRHLGEAATQKQIDGFAGGSEACQSSISSSLALGLQQLKQAQHCEHGHHF